MQKASPLLSSVVVCQTHQGEEITADILRLRRYSAAFEVYNPYSVLQVSEVLREFRIRVGDKLVYDGKAVISGLVNTGTVQICEVTLSDKWRDSSPVDEPMGGRNLEDQFGAFLQDWKRANTVDNAFKVSVADMESMLVGLKRWLDQVELAVRASNSAGGGEREVLEQIKERVREESHEIMKGFQRAASLVPDGSEANHKFYARRQIHPLVLCSPFTYRTFHKPLGYAGDYEMVNMMMRDPFEGGTLFARAINYSFLETPPVIAHRNRIKYLCQMLRDEVRRNAETGRRTRILNLGCGPAHEVQRFLAKEDLSDLCAFHLLDFNAETIRHTEDRMTELLRRHGRVGSTSFLERSVQDLLRQDSRGDSELPWESFDVVYCAGLFDYLSQRVCKKLVEVFNRLLRPGGLLVVTNVSMDNPNKAWMEYILEWNLIYRDKEGMKDLVPGSTIPLQAGIKEDATGVNYFLEIRKSAMNGART